MLKINSIKLTNYRQFKSANFDFFEKNSDDSIILIIGKNGSGKTNLANAISWCFFGKEIYNFNRNNRILLLNNEISHKMKEKERRVVSVEIQFTDINKDTIIINRSITFEKKNGIISNIITNSDNNYKTDFKLYKKTDNALKQHDKPNSVIQKLLPEFLIENISFNGEKISQYAKIQSISILQKAFSIYCKNRIGELKDKLKNEFIEKLNFQINEIFQELTDKEELWQNININSKFILS